MRMQLKYSTLSTVAAANDMQVSTCCAFDAANRKTIGAVMMTAAMSLLAVQQARAENAPERGLVALKYLDYLDSQPDKDRISVRATAFKVIAPISNEWSVGGTVTTDGISGASPAYHNSGFGKVQDRRNAIDAEVSHYLEDGAITIGVNSSDETDYTSRGLALQASHASEDRNTTWTVGLGSSWDTINPTNMLVQHEKKRATEFLVSVSNVVTMNDIVQLNAGMSRANGYFSDSYKVFDHRPRSRHSYTLMTRWNHHVASLGSTLRLNYRYFSDSWAIKAHTIGIEYVQPMTQGWTLTPLVRIYSQSAARFFVDAGPIDFPFPPNPPENAVYFSEDQRLSAFGAHTFGLKMAKQLNNDWLLDVKFEKYTQRGGWRLFGEGSPGLLPFYARSVQVGVSRQF